MNLLIQAVSHALAIVCLSCMAIAMLVMRHDALALAFAGAFFALFVMGGVLQ